jgi:hypothetical protein
VKRVLIDLEENGCTVKEAVDYLKGLGYHESDGVAIPYNAVVVCGYSGGEIIGFIEGKFSLKRFYEKLTIKEKPIVFSNPLMQHIGREVVVNDGGGDFRGWVVEVFHYDKYTVDIGRDILGYTHDAGIFDGKKTRRWFCPSTVKFVNEDGGLSDE